MWIENLDDIKTLVFLGKEKGRLFDYFIVSFGTAKYEFIFKIKWND